MTKKRFDMLLLAALAIFCFSTEGFFLPVSLQTQNSVNAAYADEDEDEDLEEDGMEDEDAAADEEGVEDEDEDEEEFDPDAPLPKPKKVSGSKLETSDGVLLSATFFPGNRGKKSVPVILLHDWNGERKDVFTLAEELQAVGCAVLVPDLRGHGKSNRVLVGPEDTEEFEAKKRMTLQDMQAVIAADMPALKRFLMQQNNAGNLNIDKLCVGGVGYGGMMAAYFANADWNPMVKRKKAKSSQGDVKGFFIVSPPKNLKGVRFTDTFSYPNWASQVSCIVIGSEAQKKPVLAMQNQLKKVCGNDALDRCKFITVENESDEKPADLIQDPDSDAVRNVLAFVEIRFIQRDILWKSR
ncbi:MAG: alpha/beta fold hydrolase [Thermoguttaceae bacterium]|nr:alpha/beta fold hydrolase [Thermoguttaceae bacterium]